MLKSNLCKKLDEILSKEEQTPQLNPGPKPPFFGKVPGPDKSNRVPETKRGPVTHKKPCGLVVKLYPMRQACREAGHCLGLTKETDCNLYPYQTGWCQERVSMKAGVAENAS